MPCTSSGQDTLELEVARITQERSTGSPGMPSSHCSSGMGFFHCSVGCFWVYICPAVNLSPSTVLE